MMLDNISEKHIFRKILENIFGMEFFEKSERYLFQSSQNGPSPPPAAGASTRIWGASRVGFSGLAPRMLGAGRSYLQFSPPNRPVLRFASDFPTIRSDEL